MSRRSPEPEMIYGVHAVRAVYDTRRHDIVRIGHCPDRDGDVAAKLEPILRWAPRAKVPIDPLTDGELDRITQSTHHEGVVIQARPRTWLDPEALADTPEPGIIVAVDRIANPHDIGAIIRTAAFFGFDGVVIAPAPNQPPIGPAGIRIAQGGCERIALAKTTSLATTLRGLARRGFAVVGTDAKAHADLATHEFRAPVAIVLGNERTGLAADVREVCTTLVAIRGAGTLDSLDVAVAAGIVMAAAAPRG